MLQSRKSSLKERSTQLKSCIKIVDSLVKLSKLFKDNWNRLLQSRKSSLKERSTQLKCSHQSNILSPAGLLMHCTLLNFKKQPCKARFSNTLLSFQFIWEPDKLFTIYCTLMQCSQSKERHLVQFTAQ